MTSDADKSKWSSLSTKMRAGFSSLSDSPRDLYIVFVLKVLESYNYFSLSRLLSLYLTENFGVDDYHAGAIYGLWGTLFTAYGFFLGGAIDVLGVRTSLVICFVLNVASRFVMAATRSKTMLLAMLLGPNSIAGALGVPVLTIAVKRYTGPDNRGFAFSLFYSLMNVAALSQGVIMDFFRIPLRRGFDLPGFSEGSLLNSGNRLFLFTGCVTSAIGLVLSFFLANADPWAKRDAGAAAEAGEGGEAAVPLLGGAAGTSEGETAVTATPAPPSTLLSRSLVRLRSSRRVMASRSFAQYLAMCLIMVNLKTVFRHLDATLPKFQMRAFGCDSPIGMIYSINPFIIVFLVPIIGALTTRFSHFDMLHLGGYLSAASPLWLVVFSRQWAAAAFVATLSLGEAVWSPRWYDYSMAVAPEGHEGTFTALASAPMFAAMLPTGMLCGFLLQTYCPDDGRCDPDVKGGGNSAAGRALRRLAQALAAPRGAPEPAPGPLEPATCDGASLWGIVASLTLLSPFTILLFQRWLRPVAATARDPVCLEEESVVVGEEAASPPSPTPPVSLRSRR